MRAGRPENWTDFFVSGQKTEADAALGNPVWQLCLLWMDPCPELFNKTCTCNNVIMAVFQTRLLLLLVIIHLKLSFNKTTAEGATKIS